MCPSYRGNSRRALEESERRRLLEVAASNPRWMAAYCAAVLALNTTLRSGEIKSLRWRDVAMFKRMLSLRKSKTDAGERSIPLDRDALWALGELWKRMDSIVKMEGSRFSGVLPDHYVLPACENHHFDFTKPMKSWRSAWRSLTKKAGLKGLRFHDLRHSSITVLAESGLSDSTIMAVAGHVSQQMLRHYSHIRMEAKRQAVAVLESLPPVTPDAGAIDPSELMDTRPNCPTKRGLQYKTQHSSPSWPQALSVTSLESSGPEGDRTPDLLTASQARSQLRHRPMPHVHRSQKPIVGQSVVAS
jgi:hypothetical protein